jgi:hypothetical protein
MALWAGALEFTPLKYVHCYQILNHNSKKIPVFWNSWIWGEAEFEDISFLPKQFLKTDLQQCELYLCSLNSLAGSNPTCQVYDPGSIFQTSKIIESKLFKFIGN